MIVPDADAAVQSRAITQWRDGVWENHPEARREGDTAWYAYLFVYAEGEDRFDPGDTYQLGTAKFVWRDPIICLMAGLNADVAAIYRADDMEHKHLCRVWARHHMITSQVSRAKRRDYMHANAVPVTRVDPPEPLLPH